MSLPRYTPKHIDEETVVYNLARAGYLMWGVEEERYTREIVPAEDILASIILEHKNARFIQGIPMLLMNPDVNLQNIYNMAIDMNIQNRVGYLLDMTISIMDELGVEYKKEEINRICSMLYEKRKPNTQYFSELDQWSPEYTMSNRDKYAEKWNIGSLLDFGVTREFSRRAIRREDT